MLNSKIFFLILIFLSLKVTATNRVSVASGNWGTAGIWSPAGIPAAGDNLTISTANTVTVSANSSCSNLTVNGTMEWSANRTINASGNLTVNNGGIIHGSGGSGTLNITGTFTVPATATVTVGKVTLSITGTTTISGTATFNNTSGTKTFGDITINNTGNWNCTAAVPFTINGNLTNNGSFNANTGVYTFAGTSKAISGSSSIIFSSVSFTGTYTNNTIVQVNVNIAAAGGITQGTNSTLIIGDPTPGGTLTASANGNTVKYLISSGNQSIYPVNYNNLIFENTGTGSITGTGTYTVTGNLDVNSGASSISSITLNGNLNVASTSTLSIGNASPTINGPTTVNGMVRITSTTGTKKFNDITVNSGGSWVETVGEDITVNGSISNSGTFTSNTGIYTLAGSGKTISGTLSISNVTVTGSYTNNAALTIPTSLIGAGTFSQGSGTLNIAATAANFSVTTFNASASGNTVNYNLGGVQSIRVPADGAYHHLTISGSNTKTLLGATTVNGNLTISAGTLSANNFNLTVGGNWSNSGTYTPGTNTTTFNGSGAQSITKPGGETFNKLTIAGSGIKTLGSAITTNSDLTISSTLDVSSSNYGVTVKGNWINNGTFTQQNGTVTFSGATAQTIGGTTATSFYNLTQSNSAGVSLTKDAILYSTLTISAGTFTATGKNFTLKSTSSETARIAAIPGGSNFAGNIIFERYTGTGPTDWRFLCSAVSGATIADWADDFATSGFTGATCNPSNCGSAGCAATCTFVSVYTYDETVTGTSDNGFTAATNTTNSISNKKGFWVYLGPNPKIFSVTGPPLTFTQSPTITYTNTGNTADDGWNMIANPYPSAIDWSSASWTKTNLDNAIYIYNSSTGSYASYVSGVGVNGGSQYIPSQQGFWVKANAASPAISGVENVKASNNPSYLKEMNSPNTSHYPMAFKDFPIPFNNTSTPNSIRFTLSGNGYEDETFIRFIQGATNNFDSQYDAWKLKSAANISSVVNDTLDFSINSFPDLNSNITIPVRVTVPLTGTYSIRRDSILMLPISSCLILEDLATGNSIDLRSNISYQFSISDTTAAPRFLLHVFAPITKSSINTVCLYDSSGIAIAKGTGNGPWNYVWTNSNGDTLKITNNSSSADSLTHLYPAIYNVEVSGSACGKVKDTIEIKSSSSLLVLLNYTDVSCYGLNDGSAYTILSGGIPPFIYSWSNGASTSAINNLSAGNYSVTVTDSLGCSQTQFVIISQPAQIISSFNTSSDTVNLSVNNSVSFINSSSGAVNYSWDFGDTTSADTSKDPVHYYNYSGSYTVCLIAENENCSDISCHIITVVDSLLATHVNENNFPRSINVIYDNGEIYLDFNLSKETDVAISIYNMIGEKVICQNEFGIQKRKVRLNTSALASGIYLSVADLNSSVITNKIIIPLR